ncbi:MAG: hypothetical protein Tsb002_38210 [Wenzhouxiangellaceae bacterium]
MAEDNKLAIEALLKAAFLGLLPIARQEGITIKRMRELMTNVQLQAMRSEGLTLQKMMAASGYSLKTMRRLLQQSETQDRTNLLERFVGDWAIDAEFPDELPLNGGKFPTFEDLCDRHARDFTTPSLLEVLTERGLVEVRGDRVRRTSRHVLSTATEDMLQAASHSISAFLSTLENNLSQQGQPLIERRFWSHRIPPERMDELRQEVKALTDEYRDDVLALLDRIELPASVETDELLEAGIGIYWYEYYN